MHTRLWGVLVSTAPLWLMAPLPDESHEPGAMAAMAAMAERAASDGSEIKASDGASDNAPMSASPAAPVSSRPSAPRANPGGSASLAALARSVAQKGSRPEAARIAKESLSVAAAARAQSDVLVERVRSVRPTPPPRRGEVTAPLPPSSRAPAHAPASLPAAARRSELGPWIAIGGLGFALAAALLVIARGREPAAQIVVAQAPSAVPPAAAPPMAAPEPSPSPVAAPAELAVAAEAAPALAPLAASALPLSPKPANSVAAARASSEPFAVAARATSGARPAPEAIQLEETPTKPKPVAEAPAPAPAAAPSGMRPASGTSAGGLPDRPSTGAVQAAVGSVMGAARACVAGGVASPAQITFGPDGSVSSVAVSGPAAGTPAASCIEAALKRARVAPFTNPSFSLGVWVRP